MPLQSQAAADAAIAEIKTARQALLEALEEFYRDRGTPAAEEAIYREQFDRATRLLGDRLHSVGPAGYEPR